MSTDDNVKTSLNKLAKIVAQQKTTTKDSGCDSADNDDDVVNFAWELPEYNELQSMYQSSRFYQDFKLITFDKEFEEEFEHQNVEKIANSQGLRTFPTKIYIIS